ncbi:MAG: GAF domain-containing protein [SAR324 cluster bacterium]|nr:GAF domain-containing protein [SAR324 cluster bacterium]
MNEHFLISQMTTGDVITALLILIGACVMGLAAKGTGRIFKLITGSTYARAWKILLVLMLFFLAGYLGVIVLLYFGMSSLILVLTGVVFLFGAVFVQMVVCTGFLTIRDLVRAQESIRKKMADLHTLNITGEVLAGTRDQKQAIKTALEVMKSQINVERGSVYLFNHQTGILENYTVYPPLVRGVAEFPKSFRPGEGLAGISLKEKKIIYVPDTSQAHDYVGRIFRGETQSLLCVPMMDDQEVFGVMNFSGKIGEVHFEPEDEEFAMTLARLTVVTIKNIQMVSVIEEQNRNLEQKVLERTEQLRHKTRDIQSMLNNMRQGVLTIIEGGIIHPEYSSWLEQMFEQKNLGGNYFADLLFDNSNLGSDQLNQIETAVDAIMGEDAFMFECNQHLFVHEYQRKTSDGSSRILEVDWNPILDESDSIEKVMVTIRDVTELRGLQMEAEQQKQELEIIGQILAISKNKFDEFLETSHQFLKENTEIIRGTASRDIDVLATLFRNMHTIKGNARTYGLKFLTDTIHEAEHTYDQLRREKELAWDRERLLSELSHAEEILGRYENIYRTKLTGNTGEEETHNRKILEQIADLSGKNGDDSQILRQIRAVLDTRDTCTMEYLLEGILKALPSLAKELDKPSPLVSIQDHGILIRQDSVTLLKSVFTHIFRNSMDHGLESPNERSHAGKPETGTITLELLQDSTGCLIKFQDDGRGLNLKTLREKGLQSGYFQQDKTYNDREIAEIIFLSGISTAQQISGISGRGVGMDAVRKFLEKHGGSIEIAFTRPHEGDYRQFLFLIHLPADTVVSDPSQADGKHGNRTREG